jgi:hypothetical protein
MAIETTRPEAFDPPMTDDELLAWLEHSLRGGEEH